MFDAKNKLSGKFSSIKEKMSTESGVAAGISNSMKTLKETAIEQLPYIVDEMVSAKIQGRSATFALQEKVENWKHEEAKRCLRAGLEEGKRAYHESLEASAAEQRGETYGASDDDELQGGVA